MEIVGLINSLRIIIDKGEDKIEIVKNWWLSIAGSGLIGLLSWWWGITPLPVQVLLGLMLLDIAAGLLAAGMMGQINASKSYHGMAKKAMILILVHMGHWLEPITGVPIRDVIAGFFIVQEAISITENAAAIGLPIPDIIKEALAKVPGSK